MIAAGSRLGPYEIVGPLGAGGMGEVYRARDTRLARDVALKVLPEVFATDPDRLSRFEREAKALAALNHPHIAQIHGFEEASPSSGQASVRVLIMELVDGPTLADRIAEGPVPLDEAAPIVRQIAQALEAAHEADIIHRDLKPANVKLRPDGVVKVLDFGLAKTAEGSRAASDMAHSPTFSIAATQVGVILGTAAYMSPEQVRGRRVDRRVDVWALGCVLFEMLSARPPFQGESINDLMAAVVSEQPDWSALPASLPVGVVRVIRRCLQKDPRQRFHDVADVRLDLDEALNEPAVRATAPPALAPGWKRALPWGVSALLLVALAAAGWRLAQPALTTSAPVRFVIVPPRGVEAGSSDWPLAVVSPDGTRVVLTYHRGTKNALYLRALSQLDAVPIQGTEEAYTPFFSPDGKWIGFTANRKLRKVALDGGAPVEIGDASWGGGAWGPDDTIVFTPNYPDGLWRVAAGGGSPQKLTDPDKARGELGHWWPQYLPDGKTILFTNFSTPAERSRIETYSLDTGQRTVVVEGATFGRYTSSGHVLFARGQAVMAVPFDLRSLKTSGQPVPVLDDVASEFSNGVLHFSVSATGALAYVPASALRVAHRLVWLDRKGTAQPVTSITREFSTPRLSPDGRRVALTITHEGDSDVWVYDLGRETLTPVIQEKASQFGPVWTADGRTLIFTFEQPVYQIFKRSADTSKPAERVIGDQYDSVPQSVTSDGRFLIYEHRPPATLADLWALPLAGGEPRLLVQSRADDVQGQVSPDGRWLAYSSDEGGRFETYVQAFPQGGARVQISNEGGEHPRWSRDGKELFFVQANSRLMSVSVGPSAELAVGRATPLFDARFDFDYDVAPDGRFIVAQRDPQAPPVPVNFVLNWFEELNAKVPAQR